MACKECFDFAGKRVLVTGGSRGIGRAIVEEFAKGGADVVVHFHRARDEAEAVAEKVRARHGVRAEVHGADIGVPAQVDDLFDQIARGGGLDILVNNAGYEDVHDAAEMPLAAWDRVMAINLRGAFHCAQRAVRLMGPEGGVVVNNSSIHDAVPRKGLAHYCCAKAGLLMMTKSLALEWAERGVRVVAVSPGAIRTEMNDHVVRDEANYPFRKWVPSGRVGEVEEVAKAVAYLASGHAAYITGTTLVIDGAYSLSTIPYDSRLEGKEHGR